MLSLSRSVSSVLIQSLVISKVSCVPGRKTEAIRDLRLKFEVAAARGMVDAIIVGGIAFFSSLGVLGYDNILLNIKISCVSSFSIAGLTFFNEMRLLMKK